VTQEFVIDYAEAKRVVDMVTAEILKRGKGAVIAVADAHGDLIALARMDGAPLSSITIAMNKAYTAARERKPSRDIGVAARNPDGGFELAYFGDSKFTGWGGGVPIWKSGKVVGAVAISGLPESEDMELAQFAATLISG
jgi:glc operon protein GlcG